MSLLMFFFVIAWTEWLGDCSLLPPAAAVTKGTLDATSSVPSVQH